ALLRQASLRLGVAPGDLRWRKGTGTAGAQRVADHMGEMRMNAEVLLWCAVINYGLLLVWVALFVLPHGWMYRLWGRWFRLSAEQFDLVNFAGIVLYKSAVLLFNLVPYIALRIAGCASAYSASSLRPPNLAAGLLVFLRPAPRPWPPGPARRGL